MATARADEDVIRTKAYGFWEEAGRPEGRENEFWMRAVAAVTEASQLQTLTQEPPKGAKGSGKGNKPPAKTRKK